MEYLKVSMIASSIKLSTYKQAIKISVLLTFTYNAYFEGYLLKRALKKNKLMNLFQARGACLKLYNVFFNR